MSQALERHSSVDVDLRGPHPVVTISDARLGTPSTERTIRTIGDLTTLGADLVYGHARRLDMFGDPA